MKIAVDFDGTCVQHEFPEVGADCPYAVEVLQGWVKEGHQLFLYTMRSRGHLQEAIDWFHMRGIELAGIQLDPDQARWTSSTKCYAEVYVDDAALGCPLIYPDVGRPYVNWLQMRELLRTKIIMNENPNPITFDKDCIGEK